MHKFYCGINRLIFSYLLLLILCLCLSACSKSEPESLGEEIEIHITQNSPTRMLIESDETELNTEKAKEKIAASEYILPESDSRFYTMIELSRLSTTGLRLARNEIYARNGRIFTADDLQLYFSKKSWYCPQYSRAEFEQKGDAVFNEFEIANCSLIVTMERLEDYKDILKEKQIRRLYVSTEHFFDYEQPNAQVIDHGSYYEVTYGCILGEDSYDSTVMEGKSVGDTLELDNIIYRITDISIWDSGDGENVSLEFVSGDGGIKECYELSRNYSDSYYTPYYYDSIMTANILYSGSLFFSKDCIVNVNDPQNEFRSHKVTADDFFSLDGDEVGAQFGGYSGGLSLWGTFETDAFGVIISYWEHFLS